MQVIGCGMSRTGTASFAKAVEILTGGPVYHGGSQLIHGSETTLLQWIGVGRHTPIKNDLDQHYVMQALQRTLDGYAACADMPPILFTGELAQLYPNAKIICTIRDPQKWWESMAPVVASTDNKERRNQLIFGYILALLPGLRHWNSFVNAFRYGRFGELYYQSGHTSPHPGQYQEHIDYLERVVPKARLHYFRVSEGWEPLCKILGCEVPNVPFPHVNDSEATDKIIKKQLLRGMTAWVVLTGSITLGVAIAIRLWMSL